MGLFSALSGKIYKWNSLNTPIDNELNSRIVKLSDSAIRLVLHKSFFTAQLVVSILFNSDEGMFRNYIANVTSERLRNVWNIIIVWHISMSVDEENTDKAIEAATIVLGLEKQRINKLLDSFGGKGLEEQLKTLWTIIINQVDKDADTTSNLTTFFEVVSYSVKKNQ